MQWTDVTRPPSRTQLRQFAGLFVVFFGGIAAWRLWHGQVDLTTRILELLGFVVGPVGVMQPRLMRSIYTGWMIVAFPIGWVVSRLVLTLVYLIVFTPMAFVFRATGRDVLQRRRPNTATLWLTRPAPADAAEYLRQS
jgi:hypothetical protein